MLRVWLRVGGLPVHLYILRLWFEPGHGSELLNSAQVSYEILWYLCGTHDSYDLVTLF